MGEEIAIFACNFEGAKHLFASVLSYGLAHSPQLGLVNTTAWAASPPLFSSTFIISYMRLAHSLHLAIIHSACINLTAILINIVLITSYLMSSMSLASSFHQHCTRCIILYNFPMSLCVLR